MPPWPRRDVRTAAIWHLASSHAAVCSARQAEPLLGAGSQTLCCSVFQSLQCATLVNLSDDCGRSNTSLNDTAMWDNSIHTCKPKKTMRNGPPSRFLDSAGRRLPKKHRKYRQKPKSQIQFRERKVPKLEFQHMPARKSTHPARRQTHVLPTTTTTTRNGSHTDQAWHVL